MIVSNNVIVEVSWNGKNKVAVEKFLLKTNEIFMFLENTDPASFLEESFLLYINSLGGYIKPSSELFIFQDRVYLKKYPL